MPTTEQVVAWSETYRVAWETADGAAAGALFSEDASYRSNTFEEPSRGRSSFNEDGLCTDLREYWQTLPELRDPWPGWWE